MNTKYRLQESQYEFPYHYIPYFVENNRPSVIRKLKWGLEYLCYQWHIIEKVTDMTPKSVLEVGCGDGYFIGNLPKEISTRVGVDLSEKAISFAKAFNPECEFYAMDANELDEKYEIVTAIEVLEHIPDDELTNFFNLLNNRVKENGKVIISTPTTVLPLNKKHYRHYTIDLFKEQLDKSGAQLRILNIEYIFSRPWWYKLLMTTIDNKIFSLEIKFLMKFIWKKVWMVYRVANKNTGFHLVITLIKYK